MLFASKGSILLLATFYGVSLSLVFYRVDAQKQNRILSQHEKMKRTMEEAKKISMEKMGELEEQTRQNIQEVIEEAEKLAAEARKKDAQEEELMRQKKKNKWNKLEEMEKENGKDREREMRRKERSRKREEEVVRGKKKARDARVANENERKLQYIKKSIDTYDRATILFQDKKYLEASKLFYSSLLLYHRLAENTVEIENQKIEGAFNPNDAISNYLICFHHMGKPIEGLHNIADAYATRGQNSLAEEYMLAAQKLTESSMVTDEL